MVWYLSSQVLVNILPALSTLLFGPLLLHRLTGCAIALLATPFSCSNIVQVPYTIAELTRYHAHHHHAVLCLCRDDDL